MNLAIAYEVACVLYRVALRKLIKSAVDDPGAEWDDALMDICDRVFKYDGEGGE